MEKEELVEHIKMLQAKAEAFFAAAGKDDIEVYRIEKFEPVRQDTKFLGKFYDGDSYVILKKNERDYDIHYWHGKHASGDEQATAAAFTVQLSDNLTLPSRHHLELMMEETQLFLSYFKSGIFYLEGGVESGFKHVEPKTYEKQLFIIKGKRYPRVWKLEMKSESLNEGDVFILDLGMKLYFWPGKEANVNEKVKGMEVLFNIRNGERGAHPQVFYPREDAKVDAEFWAELGGKPDKINPAVPDEGTQEGQAGELTYSLFKVSNETGSLLLTEVAERPLKRDHLNTNDTFILELPNQIYVWVGRHSNLEEKKNAMKFAKDFIEEKGKPKNTKVSRIPEGAEDTHFKSFFNGFYPCIAQDYGQFKNMDTAQKNLDMAKVANQQRKAADQLFAQLQDYTMDVYIVENEVPVRLPDSDWGHFFSDDLYIIDLKGKKHRTVLLWMGPKLDGQQISQTSKYMDIITNYENGSFITKQRVRKGHEDESLLSLFKDGFITYYGKHMPFLEKFNHVLYYGGLFRIQAPFGEAARAIEQQYISCQNLNSGDAFFLVAAGGQAIYLWLGLGANEPEAILGRKLIEKFGQNASVKLEFKEGEEPEEFWEALGGKTEYQNIKDTGIAAGFEPRLFQCSNAHGYFFVSEVYNFNQDDMLNDDVMLLDAYQTVFVWIGNKSNEVEKRGAYKSAQKYIESIQDERDKENVQIVEVEAGKEPSTFTVNFTDWTQEKADLWLVDDPIAAMKSQGNKQPVGGVKKQGTQSAKKEEVKKEEPKPVVEDKKYLDASSNKFPLAELQGKFPEGVDPTRKEYYLEDSVFQEAFKMSKAEYEPLKQWKKNDLKKKVNLF